MAAAPSDVCELLPAVTEPFALNAGRNLPSPSTVDARGPSSTAKVMSCHEPPLNTRVFMGTISSRNRPASIAASARDWERTANASCSSRLTSNCSATFSAVIPMGVYTSGRSAINPGLGAGFSPPMAIRVIDSTPPVSTTFCQPAMMAEAPWARDWRPELQKRLMVSAGTESGSPASKAAMRATFIPCSASGVAVPITTSSICAGSTPPRSTAAFNTQASMSSGRVSLSEPLFDLPTAVRTADTTATSRMVGSL